MTQLMAEAIENLTDQGGCGAVAKRRFLNRIHKSPDRGTKGKIRWNRDELHKR
jgi:hypothetical protein